MSLALVGMLWIGSGCIVATSVKGNQFGREREVVAVGEDVYVVDKCSGRVMTVDLATSEPFVVGVENEDD